MDHPLEFRCERHGCQMKSRTACADYQQVRPWRCKGCRQGNRARKPSANSYRIEWTTNAITTRRERRRQKITLADLNEIFGVT